MGKINNQAFNDFVWPKTDIQAAMPKSLEMAKKTKLQ